MPPEMIGDQANGMLTMTVPRKPVNRTGWQSWVERNMTMLKPPFVFSTWVTFMNGRWIYKRGGQYSLSVE